MTDDLIGRCDQLESELTPNIPGVLAIHSVGSFLDLLNQFSVNGNYKYRSPAINSVFEEIHNEFGPSALEAFKKLVLARCVTDSVAGTKPDELSPEVKQLTFASLDRILENISDSEFSYADFSADRFDKDLATASFRLLCAGAAKVHRVSFPRGLVKKNPIRWLRCLLHTGYNGTLYEYHTDKSDPRAMGDFNPAGWIEFYKRIAGLLKLNPEVKGLIGSTWFFDPQLQSISPHLGYLRSLLVDNGGVDFKLGSTESDLNNALQKSKSRKKLYEQGKYTPCGYAIIWFRKDLIAWAEQAH